MINVWYIGAGSRTITAANWLGAGITGATDISWNASNGWSVPENLFSEDQLAILQADSEFLRGQTGLRTGYPAATGLDFSNPYAYYAQMQQLLNDHEQSVNEIISQANNRNYDVIVIGATEVGLMSALAAARQGCTVLLVSQSERIGGNVGWAITKQDLIAQVSPQLVTGITREFFVRCGRQSLGSEGEFSRWWRAGGPTKPTWVKRAVAEMLGAEKNITTILSQTINAVTKVGTKITSITLNGNTYTGTIIIDGTPTGDIGRLAGCTMSSGREGNALYGETGAGVTALGAFIGGVDPYVTPGNAASGLLPGISSRAVGTLNAADPGVMAFGWRLYITSGSDKVAWPSTAPANYNALNYELMARQWAGNPTFYNATDGVYTSAVHQSLNRTFSIYAGGSGGDGYTAVAQWGDLNSGAIASSNYLNDAECIEYITATEERRREIDTNALDYIKGLIYFILHSGDSRVPANLITALNAYGRSSLELAEYDGWNPQFYIREGARIVGDYVMKISDLGVTNTQLDIIGWWCYNFDAKYVRVVNDAGVAKAEGGVSGTATNAQYGTPVSARVLYPKVTECTNLLCPGQPSVSRAVYTAMRATTSMMVLGEGAGFVAADAVRNKVNVQSINATRLRSMQNLSGLWNSYSAQSAAGDYSTGPGMVVSDVGAGAAFANIASGFRFGQHIAALSAAQKVDATVVKAKRFIPIVLRPGSYRVVHVYPPADPSEAAGILRATNVVCNVVTPDATFARTFNQRWIGTNGCGFDILGSFYFPYNAAGTTAGTYIDINASGASTDGIAVAGIIAIFPVDDITKAANGV